MFLEKKMLFSAETWTQKSKSLKSTSSHIISVIHAVSISLRTHTWLFYPSIVSFWLKKKNVNKTEAEFRHAEL